jgi:PDZ domain-containing secreted protein
MDDAQLPNISPTEISFRYFHEEEAILVSKELHLQLKIVPVATLEEALLYLKKLKS